MRIISTTAFRAARAFGLKASTTMPSVRGVVQAGRSFGFFSTSTRQTRQAPLGGRAGWSHSDGIRMLLARAACRMVTPGSEVISRPLMTALILCVSISQTPFRVKCQLRAEKAHPG